MYRRTRKEHGGQVGGLGPKRCAQNGFGFVDEGARHESGLARTHPGHRRFRSGNSELMQDAVRTAGQNQKEDGQSQVLQEVCAITSKITKAGLMPSGLHSMRCRGHAANKSEGLQDNDWMVPAKQTRRALAHVATGHSRV